MARSTWNTPDRSLPYTGPTDRVNYLYPSAMLPVRDGAPSEKGGKPMGGTQDSRSKHSPTNSCNSISSRPISTVPYAPPSDASIDGPVGGVHDPGNVASGWDLPARYTVRGLIGAGAYGTVCEAYDHELCKKAAVKKIGRLFADLVHCKRMLREISILACLRHDNVVRLYEVSMPSSTYSFNDLYLVFELCSSDLRKLCRSVAELTQTHADSILYNLLVGLNYIHTAGVFHRDLKPANCLINEDCSLKICDFGMSRTVHEGKDQASDSPRQLAYEENREKTSASCDSQSRQRTLTLLAGHVTPWYCAPEILLMQETYTAGVDIWSAGCIYAELLAVAGGMKIEDRGPLFPGLSSFPQAMGGDRRTFGEYDQLSLIFDIIGTPPAADVDLLVGDAARAHVRNFVERPGNGLLTKFSNASNPALDLLEKMLKFSAGQRIPVGDMLDHVLFEAVREPQKETTAAQRIKLDFEQQSIHSEDELRDHFRQLLLRNNWTMCAHPQRLPATNPDEIRVVSMPRSRAAPPAFGAATEAKWRQIALSAFPDGQ